MDYGTLPNRDLPHSGFSFGDRRYFQVWISSGECQPEKNIQHHPPKMHISRKVHIVELGDLTVVPTIVSPVDIILQQRGEG